MNRAKTILTPLKLINSLLSTQLSLTRPVSSQVIQFSRLSSLISNPPLNYHFLCKTHKKNLYSSIPNSILDVVLSKNWSTELESELVKLNPTWTHEIVMYVLKKLDKDPLKALEFFNWVCEKNGFRPSSAMYSLMLRVLVHKDSMKQFWVILTKMKEQEFFLAGETYMTILAAFKNENMVSDATALTHFYNRMLEENETGNDLKKMVDVVLGAEWTGDVEKELGEFNIVLSDNFAIRIFKQLRNDPSKALRFFRWVGQCPDFEHNTVTYNAIMRVLAREDSITEFWSMFEEMKSAGHEMDIDTYIKISRQFQKSRMFEEAVKLYELMMDGPYKPSVQDCTMLLRSISSNSNPNLDLVFRVTKKYEATGHSLSKALYDGIHRALTSLGRFDEAEGIMKVMRNEGCEPDNIMYSQLVFGLCKARRLEEACKMLDEMEAHGCKPDIKTWTILIKGHCAANEVDKALISFAKMMEKNYEIDADLLDVLIDGFLSQNRIDGAYKLLDEMVNKVRLRPWQATYKNLIEKLLGAKKLEEAMNLLLLMKKQNYPPFPEPFIQYISKFGTVQDAVEFFKALSVKNYPSTSAYLHLFQSFFQEGRHYEAKDLLFKSPHHVRKHDKICKLFGSVTSRNATA